MFSKKYLFIITAIMFLFSGCTNTPDIIVKAGSGEQTIKTKAGKTFLIQLDAQMSTGYSWKLVEAPSSLTTVKEFVTAEKTDKVGGIEIQEFIFKSMDKGEITLTFKYGEHWKEKPVYVKTSIIKVKVE